MKALFVCGFTRFLLLHIRRSIPAATETVIIFNGAGWLSVRVIAELVDRRLLAGVGTLRPGHSLYRNRNSMSRAGTAFVVIPQPLLYIL